MEKGIWGLFVVFGLDNHNLPSRRFCSSAAWPEGKIDLTKMPMLPLGLSLPPTTLKPRPLLPGPLVKVALWMVICTGP